jgi:crotonobetainyl-CoA:carnitine CoA-transferase CaiB-like acyl-CoA transferase
MSTQSHFYVQPLARQEEGPLGIYPYRLFDTQDRPIFIAGGTDKFWRLLCDALGVPELGTHPEYDSNPKRVHQAEALTALLQPVGSLNVSVAAGVTLFEALRQRQRQGTRTEPSGG